jgi:hypothetical protein
MVLNPRQAFFKLLSERNAKCFKSVCCSNVIIWHIQLNGQSDKHRWCTEDYKDTEINGYTKISFVKGERLLDLLVAYHATALSSVLYSTH